MGAEQKESPVWNAQPGAAHKALVKLEKAGMLTLLATQNFDALHEKAGNSPDVIVNLPGSPKAVKENLEYILPSLEHGVRIAAGLDGECARK